LVERPPVPELVEGVVGFLFVERPPVPDLAVPELVEGSKNLVIPIAPSPSLQVSPLAPARLYRVVFYSTFLAGSETLPGMQSFTKENYHALTEAQ